MRTRTFCAASALLLLTACGSGDGSGTVPSGAVSLPTDISVATPTAPAEPAPPAETQAPQEPVATLPPPEQPTEEPSAPVTLAPVEEGEEGIVWWPWVLAAVILVAAAAALLGRRKPSSTGTDRTTAMLDEIDNLTIHLTGLTPEGLRAVAMADSAQLASIRAALANQIAATSNTSERASLDRLTMPVAQLHGAVDAVALAASPNIQQGTQAVAQLATQLHTASASVRADFLLRG